MTIKERSKLLTCAFCVYFLKKKDAIKKTNIGKCRKRIIKYNVVSTDDHCDFYKLRTYK